MAKEMTMTKVEDKSAGTQVKKGVLTVVGHPAPLGGEHGLPRRRPLLPRYFQAALPELSEVPQHGPVLPGELGRLRPQPSDRPRRDGGAGPLGGDAAERADGKVLRRL